MVVGFMPPNNSIILDGVKIIFYDGNDYYCFYEMG